MQLNKNIFEVGQCSQQPTTSAPCNRINTLILEGLFWDWCFHELVSNYSPLSTSLRLCVFYAVSYWFSKEKASIILIFSKCFQYRNRIIFENKRIIISDPQKIIWGFCNRIYYLFLFFMFNYNLFLKPKVIVELTSTHRPLYVFWKSNEPTPAKFSLQFQNNSLHLLVLSGISILRKELYWIAWKIHIHTGYFRHQARLSFGEFLAQHMCTQLEQWFRSLCGRLRSVRSSVRLQIEH